MTSFDVISMPDPWEYPWYAAWDLAFHCVTHRPGRPRLRQGSSCCCCCASGTCTPTARSRRTSGRSATSTRRCTPGPRCGCSRSTAAATTSSWPGCCTSCCSTSPGGSTARTPTATTSSRAASSGWTTSARSTGRRRCRWPACWSSPTAPAGWRCTRSTCWTWRSILAEHDRSYADLATKFFEHFAYIAAAAYDQGLWDAEDGFFYDVLRLADGSQVPLKVRSVVGLLPLAATTRLTSATGWPACPRWPTGCAGSSPTSRSTPTCWAPAGRPPTAGSSGCCPWSARTRWSGCWPGCSTRRSSSRRTGCGRCPGRTWPSRSRSTWAGRSSPSATSRPSRPAACSAATPTGAARSGCRSTTC